MTGKRVNVKDFTRICRAHSCECRGVEFGPTGVAVDVVAVGLRGNHAESLVRHDLAALLPGFTVVVLFEKAPALQ